MQGPEFDPRLVAYVHGTQVPNGEDLASSVGGSAARLLDALEAVQPGSTFSGEAPKPKGGQRLEALLLEGVASLESAGLGAALNAKLETLEGRAQFSMLCKVLELRPDTARLKDFELLCAGAPELLDDRRSETQLERALVQAINAEQVSGRDALRILPEAAQALAIRAVGDATDARTLDGLLLLLTSDNPLNSVVLSAIGTLSRFADREQRLNAVRSVLYHLQSSWSESEKQTTIACLARMGDDYAVARLIPLLESENTGTRKTVHRALRTLTKLNYPESVEHWGRWLEQENAWLVERAPQYLRELDSSDPATAVAAVQALAARQLHRAELAEELVRALSHESPAVRFQACIAHQRLGQRSSIAPLERLLNDPDANTQAAAKRAVATLHS
ncbi:MAG: HEAT repeat protein [Planctomycetota bacterium]|jgi:HEAT repeat protein